MAKETKNKKFESNLETLPDVSILAIPPNLILVETLDVMLRLLSSSKGQRDIKFF